MSTQLKFMLIVKVVVLAIVMLLVITFVVVTVTVTSTATSATAKRGKATTSTRTSAFFRLHCFLQCAFRCYELTRLGYFTLLQYAILKLDIVTTIDALERC